MSGRKNCCGTGTSFEARRWLSLDVCGLLGVSLSWSVHFYALIVNAALLISNSLAATTIFFAMYIPMSFLAMASLYKAWTTNPGAVPMGARPLTIVRRASSLSLNGEDTKKDPPGAMVPAHRRGVRRCHKCNDNHKPPRAHHDSVTGRCIVKFDHFCPWIGNAVGAMNHKFFCLFLFYTACSCLLSLLLLLIRVIHCGYLMDPEQKQEAMADAIREREYEREEDPLRMRLLEEDKVYMYEECNNFYASPFVMGLLIASIVFLVFTCTMGCEQLEAIETGKGKIARMKMKVGKGGTEFSRVTEEFNEMFGGSSPRVSWHWFLPHPVTFPSGMKNVVLGYEWDPTLDAEPFEESESGSDRELDEMENGKPKPVVSRVPEGDGLVRTDSADDISINEMSTASGMKNRKVASRQESTESGDNPSSLPRIT